MDSGRNWTIGWRWRKVGSHLKSYRWHFPNKTKRSGKLYLNHVQLSDYSCRYVDIVPRIGLLFPPNSSQFTLYILYYFLDPFKRHRLGHLHGHRHTVSIARIGNMAILLQIQCIANSRPFAGTRRPKRWLVQSLRTSSILRAPGRQFGGHANESHTDATVQMERLHAAVAQRIQTKNYMGRPGSDQHIIFLSSRQIVRISMSVELSARSLYVHERL